MLNKVYEQITEKFIKAIEDAIKNGTKLPWQKPWTSGVPCNYITRKQYRGINLFLLSMLDLGSEFITFKQLEVLHNKDKNIKLKKGCKKIQIIYWDFKEKEVENEKTGKIEVTCIPFAKTYWVYSINDVENLPSKFEKFEHNPIVEADKVIEDYTSRTGIKFNEVYSDKAFYSPTLDSVTVPKKEQYAFLEEHYSTVFHELAHSTGHSTRLNRFASTENVAFGSEIYSKEELTAELCAILLNSTLGIENKKTENNSLAYLRGWLKALKDDFKLIIQSACLAQKASDYILNINFKEEAE